MAALTTEGNFKTAKWLTRNEDYGSGVFLATSKMVVKFGCHVKADKFLSLKLLKRGTGHSTAKKTSSS